MKTLDIEDILKLSRNRQTVHQAQKIAKDSYWKQSHFFQKTYWATFKGKSIQSYLVALHFAEPIVFKCNCSSRQNPCKHALGLLLNFHDNESRFKEKKAYPKVVAQWLESLKKAEDPELLARELAMKKEKATRTQSANREKRIKLMRSGAFRLQEWIQDIIKRGIAELEGQPETFWEEVLSRVIDHKLGGLARYFLELQTIMYEDENWIEKIPLKLAWLNQVLSGLQNYDQWPADWQFELLRLGGVTTKAASLNQVEGIEDDWAILHVEEGETDNGGYYRKIWMIGKRSRRLGFQMDYNYQEPKFQPLPKPGRWFSGEVVFYPGPTALRLILRYFGTALLNIKELPGVANFSALNEYYMSNLQLNPWLLELPVVIMSITPVFLKSAILIDSRNQEINLSASQDEFWKVLAISAGQPVDIFAIWNGYDLDLKGICKQGVYYSLD